MTPLRLVELLDESADLRSHDALERLAVGRDDVYDEPARRSEAATSRPMKLAPTTTTRFAVAALATIARLSANMRR